MYLWSMGDGERRGGDRERRGSCGRNVSSGSRSGSSGGHTSSGDGGRLSGDDGYVGSDAVTRYVAANELSVVWSFALSHRYDVIGHSACVAAFS